MNPFINKAGSMRCGPDVKLMGERRIDRVLRSNPLSQANAAVSPPWRFLDEAPLSFYRKLLVRLAIKARPLYVWPNLAYPVQGVSALNPDEVFYYGPQLHYSRDVKIHPGIAEYIIGVADWEISTGMLWVALRPARHHHLSTYSYEYGANGAERAFHSSGFITNRGRFLSRSQAYVLAIENKQYARQDPRITRRELYSEDLW